MRTLEETQQPLHFGEHALRHHNLTPEKMRHNHRLDMTQAAMEAVTDVLSQK